MIEIVVADWAAWAPGLHAREDWIAWAKHPYLPSGEQVPALPEVPAMQRRRIDNLGRMAVQAAWWCASADDAPRIFASRHGDVQRSLALLQQLVVDAAMSPTQFGLSVHNAIAALHSIIRGERANYLAIAGGRATAEAALVEAAGLLAAGASEVLVVMYDATLPEPYGEFRDEPDASYAWAWRVRAVGERAQLSLEWQADDGVNPEPEPETEAAAPSLPAGLQPLRLLLSGKPLHEHRVDGLRWRWRRRG